MIIKVKWDYPKAINFLKLLIKTSRRAKAFIINFFYCKLCNTALKSKLTQK